MLKKLWAAVATGAVAASLFVGMPPAAKAAVDVYTTPGYHTVNGREWKTVCSQYSTIITRCRADIRSDVTWTFNNLTYTPTTHRAWGTNPLANPGFFTSEGRRWVTSCNDQWTGPNGCRSLIWDAQHEKWVFNNLVKLTSTPFPPSSFNTETGRFATQYATTRLNLWRSDTGENHSGVIERGTAVTPTGTITAGRAKVSVNGATSWVTAKYLDITRPKPEPVPTKPDAGNTGGSSDSGSLGSGFLTTTQYATTTLKIWNAATGTGSNGVIRTGSAVQTTGVVDSGRAEIALNGSKRWLTAEYLTTTRPNNGPGPGPGGIGSGDKSLNRGWSSGLHMVNMNATKVVRHVWAVYPDIKTMYGWARRTTPDHPAGRAVDIMIPRWNTPAGNRTGWEMARFYRAHADHFGISYIIFDQQIWSVRYDSRGWRKMADRGNNTANHKDHLHVNTYDDRRSVSTFSQPGMDDLDDIEVHDYGDIEGHDHGDIDLHDLGDVDMDELGDIDVEENFE